MEAVRGHIFKPLVAKSTDTSEQISQVVFYKLGGTISVAPGLLITPYSSFVRPQGLQRSVMDKREDANMYLWLKTVEAGFSCAHR